MSELGESGIEVRRDGGRAIFLLSGVFDRASARSLRERIEQEAGAEFMLDFTRVRDFSDLGLAVVAQALARAPRAVLCRGLRQQQVRVLRYCGVAVEELTGREASASPRPGAPAASAP